MDRVEKPQGVRAAVGVAWPVIVLATAMTANGARMALAWRGGEWGLLPLCLAGQAFCVWWLAELCYRQAQDSWSAGRRWHARQIGGNRVEV